jgi:molecular chaperone GrpE
MSKHSVDTTAEVFGDDPIAVDDPEATKTAEEQTITADNEANPDKLAFDTLNDAHLRLLAEFDNYRKRTMREKADLIRGGAEAALKALLPVIDDVERAMATLRESSDVLAVKEGIELIYTKFRTYLAQQGVSVIEVLGDVLDTETSEAVTTIPAPQEDLQGKVIDCIEKGYKLNDKVIRYAKVIVANP